MRNLTEISTTDLTPIEIALQIDENGMTTAKNLYAFLELQTSHYSRWAKKNIIHNNFAIENEDYFPFVINGECGGQATTDYKITSHFAKLLSMTGKGDKSNQAREYFIACENGLKITTQKLKQNNHQPDFTQTMSAMTEAIIKTITATNASTQNDMQILKYQINQINNQPNSNKPIRKYTKWKSKTNPKLKLLAEHLNTSQLTILRNIYIEMEDTYDIDLSDCQEDYCFELGLDTCSQFDVIEHDKKLREKFDTILNSLLARYEIEEDVDIFTDKRKTIFDD